MKKLITLILALVLILSLCTAAFATGDEQVEQVEQTPAEQTEQTEVTSSTKTITGADSGQSEISYTVTGKDAYEVTYPGTYTFDSKGVAPAKFTITINDLADGYDGVELSLVSSTNSFQLKNGSNALDYGFVTSVDKDGKQYTEEKDGATVNTTKTLSKEKEEIFLVTTFDNKTMEKSNTSIDINVTITSSIANIPHGTYSDTVTFKAAPRAVEVEEETT